MKKLQFILFALLVIENLPAQNIILENGIDKLNLMGSTIQDGEIRIVGTGNFFSNRASFPSETTLDEIDQIVEIKVLALDVNNTFHFSIGKQSWGAGTMVEFTGNTTSSLIKVDRMDNSNIINVKQYILPFNIVVGTKYTIRIGKRQRNLQIEITSSNDHYYNDSLYYPTPFFGVLWGTPFIAGKDGEIGISNFTLSTPFNTSPRLAVWGDSFIEGSSLANYQDRYISLLQDSIGHQNVSIMGRGGENSSSLYTRFPMELKWFKNSKYALLAIGVNEGNFSSWESNTLKTIDSLKKNNIIPIIATLTPRFDRLPFISQVNYWIRNTYNGRYIDISKAVSPDDVSWLPGYNLADNVHPSVVGHQSIFERIKIDAPYLFMENVFSIDYINETTLESVSDSLEFSVNFNFITANLGNNTPNPVIPGTTMFVRDTTTNGFAFYEKLLIPNRPDAPAATLPNTPATFDWIFNPNYVSILDYEYSNDNGNSWVTCFQKPIISIGSSELQLRIKATASNFKSPIQNLYNVFSNNVSAIGNDPNIMIYPNPVNDILTIENISEETNVRITLSDGHLIKSILLSDKVNTIYTDELKAGLYFISLASKSFTGNYKIIKK